MSYSPRRACRRFCWPRRRRAAPGRGRGRTGCVHGRDDREQYSRRVPRNAQSALFHQVQAELPEAEPDPVIPEARTDRSEPDVGEARSVAVAMLQAEIRHPADDEEDQIVGNYARLGRAAVRTSMVARPSGSVISGSSTSSSIRRFPICRQRRSYSSRTSSFVGCGDHRTPDAAGSRDMPRQRDRCGRALCTALPAAGDGG